jgi:SAM-dependent methyltransferase
MDSGTITLESMSEAPRYNKWLLNKFKPYLKGEILEVGCGIGNFTELLTEFGKVTAVDISKDYVLELKRNLSNQVEAGLGDIEKGKFFFKQKRFDSIICLNVLEHIKNDEQAFKNLHSLLKPKGNLILIVPGHQNLYGEIDKSIDHFRRYDKKTLMKKLEKKGFKILKSRKLNFIGAIGWFFAGKVFKQKTVKRGNVKAFNLISPIFLFAERFFEPFIGTSVFVVARRSH